MIAGPVQAGRGKLVWGAGHGGEHVGEGDGLVWDLAVGATTESHGAIFWLGKGAAKRHVVPQPARRALLRSRLFQAGACVERHRVSLCQEFSIVLPVPCPLAPHELVCGRARRMFGA